MVVIEALDGGVDYRFVGGQVAKPKLAVLEHLLDIFAVVLGAQEEMVQCVTLSFAVGLVPGMESAADTRAGIARRGLDPDVLIASGILKRRDQRRVEHQAAAQAKVLSLIGETDDGIFDGALHARGNIGAILIGEFPAVFQTKCFVEAVTESARRGARGVKVALVQCGVFVGAAKDIEKQITEASFAALPKPLDFVLFGAGAIAEQLRDATVEVGGGVRSVEFLRCFDPRPFGIPARAATHVADAIERDHAGLVPNGDG